MARKKGSGNYPHDFKRQVVAETFVDGATVAAVARVHGLNANMVFQWRKDRRFAPSPVDLEPHFLPVEIDSASTTRAAATFTGEGIEIMLANGHRVSAKANVPVETLLRIVRELAP